MSYSFVFFSSHVISFFSNFCRPNSFILFLLIVLRYIQYLFFKSISLYHRVVSSSYQEVTFPKPNLLISYFLILMRYILSSL